MQKNKKQKNKKQQKTKTVENQKIILPQIKLVL